MALRADGQPLGQQSRLAIARRGREKSEADSEAPVEKGEETGTGKRFGRWRGRDEVGGENKRGRRCGRSLIPEDEPIEALGLFQRLNVHLSLEEIPIGAILAESLDPLTGLPVEAHEETVYVLLERIKDKEALTSSYGLALLTPGNETLDKRSQGAEEQHKEAFPFKGDPFLKIGGAGNEESGQKVALVEVEGPTDPADTLRSGRKMGLQILEARLENLFEIEDVHPARGSGGDANPGALDGQTDFGGKAGLGEDAAEMPQRAAEVVTSLGLDRFTPQESGQVLAREPLLGLTG